MANYINAGWCNENIGTPESEHELFVLNFDIQFNARNLYLHLVIFGYLFRHSSCLISLLETAIFVLTLQ